MSNALDSLSEALLGFAQEGAAPPPPAQEPVGNAAQTLAELSEALLAYLTAVESGSGVVTPVAPERKSKDDDTYSGFGFSFDVGVAGGGTRAVTALLVGIDGLFGRVCRYTAQKARFISVAVGSGSQQSTTTNVDLYAFSADERALYLQFLREGANRLWTLLAGYAKGLPFRGYLFDEGVGIDEQTADSVYNNTWNKGDFVRVGGKIYKALEDVPENTEITDTDYWQEASALYDTRGAVVFFVDVTDPVRGNSLVQVLRNVEDFLYGFVLWRWYVLSGVEKEAQVWGATAEAAYGDVKGALLRMRASPTLRGVRMF